MDDPGRIEHYRDEIIPDAPLYDARFEHDACGVGFVAESRNGPSERVLALALEALGAMAHRGATAALLLLASLAPAAVALGPEASGARSRVERWRGGLGGGMSGFPGFPFVAQNRMPCSVSTSRSSNRTGGFPASGSRTRTHACAHSRRRCFALS